MAERLIPNETVPPAITLLGTPLQVTSYSDLVRLCQQLQAEPRPWAIEFCNTQIVTMRRHEAEFRKQTRPIDLFIPDGMPLVWCLNLRGAGLKDRVYGPTFMRQCFLQSPRPMKHYLLGGSEECGRRLKERFTAANPNIEIVGAFHGRCDSEGVLGESGDERVLAEINMLSPDFIWVGLGTPKQQAWIERNKGKIKRGLLLSVGFAFDVNAGMKPDAPGWMQRLGLTWLFRMVSEPTRLIPRYFRYNSLFFFYLIWDGLRGRAFSTTFPPQKPEVA